MFSAFLELYQKRKKKNTWKMPKLYSAYSLQYFAIHYLI